MYEKTGRYYALFGPKAVTTSAEIGFFRHWSAGCSRALDLGAGLCGPATALARIGLDVLGLREDLRSAGFGIERAYQAYDLDAPFADGSTMLVAVARSVD